MLTWKDSYDNISKLSQKSYHRSDWIIKSMLNKKLLTVRYVCDRINELSEKNKITSKKMKKVLDRRKKLWYDDEAVWETENIEN